MTVVMEGDSAGGELGRRYRDAATQLFEDATGRTDVNVILAGGRTVAAKEFERQLRIGNDDVVLLVDSEALVPPGTKAWDHLASLTGGDQIHRPPDAADDDAQLMVVVTETWVLSGRHLDQGTAIDPLFLDEHADTEGIDKPAVMSDAKKVFPGQRMKRDVLLSLAKVDHRRLRVKCPHAEQFFTRIS